MAEYEVLVRHTVDLQLAVKENLTYLGARLIAAQIITPDQYEEIRNAHRPINKRVADLVGYVQNKVRQDPRHYHAFIGALKSDLAQYGGILTKLEQTRLQKALELQPLIPQPPTTERRWQSSTCSRYFRLCSSRPRPVLHRDGYCQYTLAVVL